MYNELHTNINSYVIVHNSIVSETIVVNVVNKDRHKFNILQCFNVFINKKIITEH